MLAWLAYDGAMAAAPPFPPVILTIDCVLLTLLPAEVGKGLAVALQVRPNAPFAGMAALPGGYVRADADADLAAAARRVLAAKLAIAVDGLFLEQLCTVSGAHRDPRGWSASVVYYALVPEAQLSAQHGERLGLARVDALPPLAFDHGDIVAQAVARLRSKTGYSNLPGFLLPPTFTLPELQDVYERVLGRRLDQSVFRRRMDELALIEPVPDGFRTGGRHRPAQLYRLSAPTASLHDRQIAQRPRIRSGDGRSG